MRHTGVTGTDYDPYMIPCPSDGAEICKNCRYYGSVTTTDTTWYCARTIAEVGPNASCEYWKPAKQTNADRIRSMTDEELSSWLNDHADCNSRCEALNDKCMWSDSTCMAAWLEWLKEVYE